jgi:hypothetical protein
MNVLLSVLCVRVVFVERLWGGRGKQDCAGKRKINGESGKKNMFALGLETCACVRECVRA